MTLVCGFILHVKSQMFQSTFCNIRAREMRL